MEYNMENYLRQIVEDYEELATELMGTPIVLGKVPTPFLEEDCSQADARAPVQHGDPMIDCPYCRHSFLQSHLIKQEMRSLSGLKTTVRPSQPRGSTNPIA